MRLNHEQANRLAGVLKEKAIKTTKGFFRKREVITGYETKLTRGDIEQMIADEARNKVFGPVMRNFESADFGNRQLVGKVESAAQIELRKTMELWGMSLENIYVDWNRNAYQEWKAERAPKLWQEKARREFEIDETAHTEKVIDIREDAARERRRKDSEQDMSELSELMKIKEMMNQQKIDRKKSAADSELEIEKVKAQAQIEAAKHNLESYKEAQAAESEKMLRMMEIMQGKKKKMTKNNPTILGGLLRYQWPLIFLTYILFISLMYLYAGLLFYQWLLVVWTSFLFFSVLYLYLKRRKEPKIQDYNQRKDKEPQIELREAQRKAEEEEKQLRNEREQKRIAMKHKANERERALDYDSAIDIWEELGQIDQAARVRN